MFSPGPRLWELRKKRRRRCRNVRNVRISALRIRCRRARRNK